MALRDCVALEAKSEELLVQARVDGDKLALLRDVVSGELRAENRSDRSAVSAAQLAKLKALAGL